MKSVYFLILIVFVTFFSTCAKAQTNIQAQTNTPTPSKSFASLTEKEKADFVAAKLDEITMKISGKKYLFNADFQVQVSNYLDSYSKRIGSNAKNRPFGEDLNFVFERGSEYAPTINAAFDKNGVSRLAGLYIAMIETEFNNDLVSPTGSSGVFMLTAAQAQKYGMTKKDLADLSKSAEILARQIIEDQKKFESNNMKEFLAILSHNRDPKIIAADLDRKTLADEKDCSICGMTKNAATLDKQFQSESVKYIPKFLAAAIIGENPQDFGLTIKPLSTLTATPTQPSVSNNSDLNVSVDYWKQQLNKSLEVRNAPVGELKNFTISPELVSFNGKQSTTLAEMKAQGFAIPMDFFDLAERNLNKELVELPSATENYVLDIRAIDTNKVFTIFNFKNGATVPAANSDRMSKMKELSDNFGGQKFDLNNPLDRKEIRQRLLRMISPKSKTVLEEIARQYSAKFNRPLRVTSLVRSLDYSVDLNKVDATSFKVSDDGRIPPHCSGLAFDFTFKNMTAEEQNFIADLLIEMEKTGKIDAIRENGPNAVFHVFVL
jgi:hypothetical protein